MPHLCNFRGRGGPEIRPLVRRNFPTVWYLKIPPVLSGFPFHPASCLQSGGHGRHFLVGNFRLNVLTLRASGTGSGGPAFVPIPARNGDILVPPLGRRPAVRDPVSVSGPSPRGSAREPSDRKALEPAFRRNPGRTIPAEAGIPTSLGGCSPGTDAPAPAVPRCSESTLLVQSSPQARTPDLAEVEPPEDHRVQPGRDGEAGMDREPHQDQG
jgi:hypothetical protein